MRRKIKLSIVVTSNEDERLFNLIHSIEQMQGVEYLECIIVLDIQSENYFKAINNLIEKAKGKFKIILAKGKTRCERKDIGVANSLADYVCFVDSDCVFDSEYYNFLKPHLNHHEVIRGSVRYLKGTSWIGTMNSYYRHIADNILFVNETFTPNLIIKKTFLQTNGGWTKDNIDEQDDYILSQRLKKHMSIPLLHLNESVVIHTEDTNFQKLKRSWIGYGKGYGFRYWMDQDKSKKKLLKYLPPFPYKREFGTGYFVFCIIHYYYMCIGYVKGLLDSNK
ncbi:MULTISPECIES: glycosyltransferase family 2 protein [Bacillus cereus group]|uniref:glycosyltransferase family 2 protein n=1 Tax=Bacillus cereus group TaxID=86661 RepID=UPI001F5ADCCA|nr:glycosyltransferase family 2 protein [Bacillus pacificus]MED0823854.1 glycosyltransferase family 2 protein [Bacillus pacificus]